MRLYKICSITSIVKEFAFLFESVEAFTVDRRQSVVICVFFIKNFTSRRQVFYYTF